MLCPVCEPHCTYVHTQKCNVSCICKTCVRTCTVHVVTCAHTPYTLILPYTHVHSAHSPFHKGVFVCVQCLPSLPSPHTPPLTQLQSKRDHWEIDFLQLKIKEKIGSGSYGTVYKSEWHGVFFLSILVSIPVGRKAVAVTLFNFCLDVLCPPTYLLHFQSVNTSCRRLCGEDAECDQSHRVAAPSLQE